MAIPIRNTISNQLGLPDECTPPDPDLHLALTIRNSFSSSKYDSVQQSHGIAIYESSDPEVDHFMQLDFYSMFPGPMSSTIALFL